MSVVPMEVTTTKSPAYVIHASWGPRADTPAVIAARFLACVDRLQPIHPSYDNWIFSLDRKPRKLASLRADLPAAITANVVRGDDGDPEPIYGYWARAINSMRHNPHSLSLRVKAGAQAPGAASGDGGPQPDGQQPSGAPSGGDDDAIDAEFEVKK